MIRSGCPKCSRSFPRVSKELPFQDQDLSPSEQTRPSKSQRKRDAQALQRLGVTLVDLPQSQLARLALDEKLTEAIQQARDIKPGGARKRQIQHIGRLLRQTDAEAIRQNLPGAPAAQARATRRRAYLERVVRDIGDGSDGTIENLVRENPTLERQRLRQLVRNLRQCEPGSQGKQRALEALQHYLSECLSGPE